MLVIGPFSLREKDRMRGVIGRRFSPLTPALSLWERELLKPRSNTEMYHE